MSLFGKIVRTAVNVAALPVAVVTDIFTVGGLATDQRESYTTQQIEQLKDEAED